MISQFAPCGSTSLQAAPQYLLYNPIGSCINLLFCWFYSSTIFLLWKQEFLLTDVTMLRPKSPLYLSILRTVSLRDFWDYPSMWLSVRRWLNSHPFKKYPPSYELQLDFQIIFVNIEIKSCKNHVRFMGSCRMLFSGL